MGHALVGERAQRGIDLRLARSDAERDGVACRPLASGFRWWSVTAVSFFATISNRMTSVPENCKSPLAPNTSSGLARALAASVTLALPEVAALPIVVAGKLSVKNGDGSRRG